MHVNFQNSSDTCNLYGRLEDSESAEKRVETKQSYYKKNKVCDRRVMMILIVVLIILNVILVGLVSTVISRSDQELHFDSARVTTAAMSTEKQFDQADWPKSKDIVYKCFSNARHDYANATAICGSYGGRLAAKVLRDPVAITDFATRGCFNNSDKQGWIGFDDIEKEGDWRWSDGGTMNYMTIPWDVGQPDKGHLENCATIRILSGAKVVLHDYPCKDRFPYICEIETANSDT